MFKKFLSFVILIAIPAFLILLAHSPLTAGCDCNATYISNIGMEYLAATCPPQGANDNTYYNYHSYYIRCGANISINYYGGDEYNTPASLGGYWKYCGYRVLRNTSVNIRVSHLGVNFSAKL